MKYKKLELPHGGKLYYVRNKFNASTMVNINFDCGARYDTIPGLAHFTEHMFFNGTSKLNKQEITKKYFDFIGTNASTNIKTITFTGHVFTKELKDYLSTVSDIITDSTFAQEEVDKEIPIVQQEIARRKDKYDIAAEWFNDYNLYGTKVFKNTVLGSQESVAKIKSEDVKEFVKKYFVANNLEVLISSPLSARKVKKIVVDSLAKNLIYKEYFTKDSYNLEKIKTTDFYKIHNQNIGKNYLFLNFNLDKTLWDFDFKYKFGLVLDMINETSRGMKKELRLEKSLTYSAWMGVDYCEKNGYVTFRTECDKENVNEIIKTLAEYLKKVYKNGFTEEELKVAKRDYEYREMTKEEYLRKDFFKLYDFKYYNKIIKNEDCKKVVKATTLDECNTLFREVFSNAKVGLSVFGNAENVLTKSEIKKLYKMTK